MKTIEITRIYHTLGTNRRLQLSKMTEPEPVDAGGHIRALAAEDKTYGETLRRTIMASEEDEVSTTQEIANRHKPDKAARDLE